MALKLFALCRFSSGISNRISNKLEILSKLHCIVVMFGSYYVTSLSHQRSGFLLNKNMSMYVKTTEKRHKKLAELKKRVWQYVPHVKYTCCHDWFVKWLLNSCLHGNLTFVKWEGYFREDVLAADSTYL